MYENKWGESLAQVVKALGRWLGFKSQHRQATVHLLGKSLKPPHPPAPEEADPVL